jgi:maleamate amidohydrolase
MMSNNYGKCSYGAHDHGWGVKPAVVIVDFQRGFIDPAFPMGGAEMVD